MRLSASKPWPATLVFLSALGATALAPRVASAAEITEVADAADGDDPFDFELELGWDRWVQQTTIARETLEPDPDTGAFSLDELTYKRAVSTLHVTGRAGLYKDLEIHFTLPYVFGDNQTWHSAARAGLPENSTILNPDGICANGTVDTGCAGELFDYNGSSNANNSYRAGLDDFRVGLAWGIMNDQRDRWNPTWVIGFDWRAPTAKKRSQSRISHDPQNPETIGEKTNYFSFRTAMSKNLGLIDPFLDIHYRLPVPQVPHAWHNCERADQLADYDPDIEPEEFGNTCSEDEIGREWIRTGKNRGGYQPSHVGGVTFGAEFLPYVDPERFVRVAFQLSFTADYVSEGRVFNELSDALQKTLYGSEFLRLLGTVGVRVQASRFAKFHVLASFGTETSHFLTGESIGVDLDGTGLVELPGIDTDPNTDAKPNPEQNPNYDFRYDQPGRRFLARGTTLFGLTIVGELDF